MPPVSFADLDVQKMELTPMRVLFTPPGETEKLDLGGTLDNIQITMAYKKADMKADQMGSTVLDRRVSGIEIKVATALAEIQNKDLFKIAFPHSTKVADNQTGGTMTAVSPAVANFTANGLRSGDRVRFVAGTVPTGVSLNNWYYVLSAGLTANAFEFSETKGGAPIAGSGSAGTGIEMQIWGAGAIDFLSAIGDGDQSNAGKLELHPLSKPLADVDTDWTFWKATATAESDPTFGPEEQAKLKVVWTILPDLSVTPARFFRYGDTTLV